MKSIKEYVLGPVVTLDMPRGAQILSIGAKGEGIFLWALVDEKAEIKPRKFMIYGTGQNVPDADDGPGVKLSFIGSALSDSAGLDFHVFEILQEA